MGPRAEFNETEGDSTMAIQDFFDQIVSFFEDLFNSIVDFFDNLFGGGN